MVELAERFKVPNITVLSGEIIQEEMENQGIQYVDKLDVPEKINYSDLIK